MKSVIFFAALAAAAPVVNQRDLVYDVVTEEVVKTLWTTTTTYVDPSSTPANAAPANAAPAGFYETYRSHSPQPTTATTSSTSVSSTPTSPPTSIDSSSPPPPTTTTTSSSAYVAPPPPSSSAPASAIANAASSPSSSPSSSSGSGSGSGSSSSAQGEFTGDITYYDVTVGTSSCGWSYGENSQALIAVAAANMDNGANPNANPNCGKTINIYYNGQVHSGKVYDTCPDCAAGSLDLTQSLFEAVAPNGDGRVHGVTWSWA